ncbi:ketopantoate reductase family protein [Streptomyces shenzhenensis]|uniref:ketopantoate reductase family protein n=1 Tax=Streptomyces shenzhenensis TaxID=943815 RepID=UPI001F4889A3|nr:ketopantoate reductase family protein [Streptomyces shenzhenensis]
MTRILIVGAGATGGYFGARLAGAARDVTFLVRPLRAAELRAAGLRVTTPEGTERLEPKLVTATELGGPYDLILLTVKAGSLEAALQDLKPAVGPRTVIIPFLNGIGHLGRIDTQFPSAVLGAVVKVVAQLTPDGAITVSAPAASLEIGELDGERTTRLRDAAAALDVAGFDVDVSDHILTSMWHKWVFIATTTTITCLAQGTIGDVAAVGGGKGFSDAVLAETAAVSDAAGHPLPDAAYLTLQATVTQEGSPFAPSMYRDVKDARPTEVEHVLASLARAAKRLGLATPLLNAAVVRLRVHNQLVANASRPR